MLLVFTSQARRARVWGQVKSEISDCAVELSHNSPNSLWSPSYVCRQGLPASKHTSRSLERREADSAGTVMWKLLSLQTFLIFLPPT